MPEFTQDAVNAIAAQAREEGRKSAEAQLTTKYEAELEKRDAALTAAKTQLDDLAAKHKAVTEEYAAKTAEWKTATETHGNLAKEHEILKRSLADRDLEDDLVVKGVKAEHKRDMRILLQAQGLLVDEQGNAKDTAKVLEEVKAKYTSFFADAGGTTTGTRNSGTKNTPPQAYDILSR